METRVTEPKVISKIHKINYTKVGEKTTICTLTLKNGFEVVGTSSCVDARNFNEMLGESIAYKDAINKVELLEGYLLQEELGKVKGVELQKSADYHAIELLKKDVASLSVDTFMVLAKAMERQASKYTI